MSGFWFWRVDLVDFGHLYNAIFWKEGYKRVDHINRDNLTLEVSHFVGVWERIEGLSCERSWRWKKKSPLNKHQDSSSYTFTNVVTQVSLFGNGGENTGVTTPQLWGKEVRKCAHTCKSPKSECCILFIMNCKSIPMDTLEDDKH